MLWVRLLPWDYGVRNLFRRASRSGLTVIGLSIVVFLVLTVAAFVRGLEVSLQVSGDPQVVLIHSLGAAENLENATVPGSAPGLLAASLSGITSRSGQKYVSPELYLGAQIMTASNAEPAMGLVRGVSVSAPLVRRQFQLIDGQWPARGEVLVGRLAAAKLGRPAADLLTGSEMKFEGKTWRVAGQFAAAGSALESEIWCLVDELQGVLKRQDLSLVAITVDDDVAIGDVQEFCKERIDLEWEATRETAYYASLQKHYGPIRMVAWLIVGLMGSAGIFAGLNTMYGAVLGRVRELAMLQTVGFSRRAIVLSIVQEGLLLAMAASLLATGMAMVLLNGLAVRFTMGAFALQTDSTTVVFGLLIGIAIGVLGSLPPALRALQLPVVDGLKAV
ncbi:MAG: hypothetical protein JWN70_6365 [Planctomycetaceae bacterium]|nr:hypothetical protein [Planctomycetaceae bacterium]